MRMLNSIISAFNQLFRNFQTAKYDDSNIVKTILSFPNSVGDILRSQIKTIVDETHQVYNAANNKEFTIGIIGDFSVGKSSFVNAILGDRIAPVSANPCTAIITKIKYGSKPRAVVRYKDGREIEMTYEAYLAFSAFNLNDFQERASTQDVKRFKDIEYATVFVKSNFLKKNSLCIVDTLGLSADDSDNQKTIASIKDAIAIIYISEERGLTDKDVQFISSYLNIEKGDFFFCINRIDLVRKEEKESIRQLVKLKLDDILQNTGSKVKFSASHIYLVSSLYQEFANGFTDHEKYHKGIDYQSRSGFAPIMNDIAEYVKNNVNTARKRAINKQLEVATTQIQCLRSYREMEINYLIAERENRIAQIQANIVVLEKQISYTNSLFQKLEQMIYSFMPGLFNQYYNDVNKGWHYTLTFSLIDKVSFGIGDYLKLEKDIMALQLNVFKSMTDVRYAKLNSLTPFVNTTLHYLEETLKPVIYNLKLQIEETIKTFAIQYSYQNIFSSQEVTNYIHSDILPTMEDVKHAMYRAVAQAGTESTWMKNKNRKEKMFNAALSEALKVMEKPFKCYFEQTFQNIKLIIHKYNQVAINDKVVETNNLNEQKQKLEEQIEASRIQWNEESAYFKQTANMLSASLLPL